MTSIYCSILLRFVIQVAFLILSASLFWPGRDCLFHPLNLVSRVWMVRVDLEKENL